MKIWKNRKKKKQSSDLQKLIREYSRRTAEITDEMAMDMLDTAKRNDYLALLKIADHARTGKSRAILISYKLGILKGQELHREHEQDFQETASGVLLKIQRASAVLQAAVEANLLNRTDLTRDEMLAVGACAQNIGELADAAQDYLVMAQRELGGILE